jgi:hypothetical protein
MNRLAATAGLAAACGRMDFSEREQPGQDQGQALAAVPRHEEPSGYGRILLTWIVLVVLLNAVRWAGGFPSGMLARGIEQGVAQVETTSRGEVDHEAVRKAIRLHRESHRFWSALVALGDFLVEPLWLAARAIGVATLLTGVAALTGRTPQFDRALRECSAAQVFWVVGLAVRVLLMVALRRGEDDVDVSLALLLPAGVHPAPLWLVYRQIDPFSILGWLAMAVGGWKRGDAPLWWTLAICGGLAVVEILLRVSTAAVIGGAIRMSLITT